MVAFGMNVSWGQTYYVFKYDGHYLAHNGYTTDGSEICAEDEFSFTKCLWEYSDGGKKNQKYLKTYGADYWLYYLQKTENNNNSYVLALKNTAPLYGNNEDGWREANASDGIIRYLQIAQGGSWIIHYVCYDENNSSWELVYTTAGKALAYEVTITADAGTYQGPQATISGADELSDYGTSAYSASPTIASTTYSNYSFDESNHYWYEESDHGNLEPEDWSGTLTSSWGISDNKGYATIDASGHVTVHKLPASDLVLNIQLTVTDGTHSCVFTKPVTLKGTGRYVIKDDTGRMMQLSGTSLGETTTFNADNTVWTSAVNGTGNEYTITSGETTYYLSIANWKGSPSVPTEARVNTAPSEYNRRWFGISPTYLSSAGGYYVYRDNNLWNLTKDEVAHRVIAYPVTKERVSNTKINGTDEITMTGDYTYTSATNYTNTSYDIYAFDGEKHYWYGDSDHDAAPTDWDESANPLTRAWTLMGGDGYATVNETTGVLSVTALPTTGSVSLTLKCTISSTGHDNVIVEKPVILKGKEVKAPVIRKVGNTVVISSSQPDVTLYYETGASEPKTETPDESSEVYDSDNPLAITSDLICVKAVAVSNEGIMSQVAVYNILNFSEELNIGKTVAPFVSSIDLAKPDGMKVYYVSRVTPLNHSAVLKELKYIPKDMPVLLLDAEKHTGPTGDITFSPKQWITSEVSASDKAANQLHVTDKPMTVQNAQVYMYYNGEFVLTLGGTMKVGRYYLYNPNYDASVNTTSTTSGNAPLQLVIEATTGIDDVRCKMDEGRGDKWYTLDGRQLQGKPTTKGLYINNGRKMIVK